MYLLQHANVLWLPVDDVLNVLVGDEDELLLVYLLQHAYLLIMRGMLL